MTQEPITLQVLIQRYLAHLKAEGKHPRTLYTYGKDCSQILAHFGSDRKLCNILPAHVARFYKSDEFLKIPKTGQDRAPATVAKTQRVLRQLLTWAKGQGHIPTVPLPKTSSILAPSSPDQTPAPPKQASAQVTQPPF